jgi:DNA polymerase (family X)
MLRSSRARKLPLAVAHNMVHGLLRELGACDSVEKCQVGGSIRRRAPTIGDIDILAASSRLDDALRDVQATLKRKIGEIRVKTIADVGYKIKLASCFAGEPQTTVEIWIVPPSHYGSTLSWITGSRLHNTALRLWCLLWGYKVPIGNHRITKSSRIRWLLCCYTFSSLPASSKFESEEEFYNRIGLDWIPPISRQGAKEIWKARRRSLRSIWQISAS